MWSETVGEDRSDTKKTVLVLVLQVWCCVVKHGLVTLIIMISKGTATFQVLSIVSLFCAWNITTVITTTTVAFTYVKVKSTKCLCLLTVVLVLVLRIRSCLHHCAQHVISSQVLVM